MTGPVQPAQVPRCSFCGGHRMILRPPLHVGRGPGFWVCPACDRAGDMTRYLRGVCRHWDQSCPGTLGGA